MKYEKPDLEELELILEGSFLESNSEYINKGDEDDPITDPDDV